ncbi:MAG TPA: pseudouridine synthase [Polyangiaceae bacterium]|nr:pseudouridine synthase [Polyangiaceae bacterium]
MPSDRSSVRLQKVLARAGVASRRAAEQLIAAGRVRVDGRLVTELGTKVDPRADRVEVDGQRIAREAFVYIVLHKPRGTVSTMHDPQGRPTVRELFADAPARVYPVGRLDFNTSGVLLATNDGDFAEGLTHPRRSVPKTYVVKVQGALQPADLDAWRRGVRLDDGPTRPARAKLLRHEGDKTWFELTITEGRNQQVRRMGEATGFRVMRLARTAFAGVRSEGMRPGEWRYLTTEELARLKKDYGVPRRVVSPPQEPAKPRARPRPDRPRGEGAASLGRYGGGAPARRDPDVADDWGGRLTRGSSHGGRDHRNDRRDGREGSGTGRGGGRWGAVRTTGTGGGVGADEGGDYRVSGRGGRGGQRSSRKR